MAEKIQTPNSLNLSFAESLYADYLREPESVPPDWRRYFEALLADDGSVAQPRLAPSFRPPSLFNPSGGDGRSGKDRRPESEGRGQVAEVAALQDRVDQLIRAYRVRGHLVARLDPLERPRPHQVELDPEFYGFTEKDLDRLFSSRTIHGTEVLTLRQILERLRRTYCGYIGVQFMHIDRLPVKEWLQERMAGAENRPQLSVRAQRLILMSHRGRLNVLANILGKSPREIFREFEDTGPELHRGRHDVKYHLGYSADWETYFGAKVHLSLCFNPSHLEFVNPVALGRMRARRKAPRLGRGRSPGLRQPGYGGDPHPPQRTG